MFESPIAIGLSPNLRKEDVQAALCLLVKPQIWKSGAGLSLIRAWFQKTYPGYEIFTLNSGRSALYLLLKTFGIGKGDEVLIQPYTCVAVPNAVIWTGARPVYVDIDSTLNINPDKISSRITPRTKAIITQHTFGIPGRIDRIAAIARKYRIFLFEDCAHSLGAVYNNKLTGGFGHGAVFSFGRDKVVSSVFGGVGIIKRDEKSRIEAMREICKNLPFPPRFWILQQLLHPIFFYLILPLYDIKIGKAILAFAQKIKLLSFPVFKEEYHGGRPAIFPAKMPNAFSVLALNQLNRLAFFNRKRQQNASYYYENLKDLKGVILPALEKGAIYLRFNILTGRAAKILKTSRRHGLYLGNWYRNIIDPKGVNFSKTRYRRGSCPKAEDAARHSVNLPTYPRLSVRQIRKIIRFIREYV